MSKHHPSSISSQDDALDDFFESLMRDVEAVEQPVPEFEEPRAVTGKVVVEEKTRALYEGMPTVVPLTEKTIVTPESEVKIEAPVETPVEVQAEPVVEQQQTTELESAQEIAEEADVEQDIEVVAEANTISEIQHAGESFQVMLFRVGGLKLAVPLVELNGIVEWDKDKLTTMPGHKDFFLGLLSHLDNTIPVIDTARFVLPPDKQHVLDGQDIDERVTRIVLIDDSRYGLACDEVNEVITLKPEEVRWRSQQTQRQWLAGTVIEHMCALVDPQSLSKLLQDREEIEVKDT